MESSHTIDPRVLGLSADTPIVYHAQGADNFAATLRRLLPSEYQVLPVHRMDDFLRRLEASSSEDAIFISDTPPPRTSVLDAKDFLAQFLMTREASADLPDDLPGGVRLQRDETYFSFGEERGDQVLYLCGPLGTTSGFFGEYLFTLNQVVYAQTNGFVPVVDWQTCRSNLSGSPDDFWHRNVFNYFFEDVAGVSVDEALRSKHVVVCHSRRPTVVSVVRIFIDEQFRNFVRSRFKDYFTFTPRMKELLAQADEEYFPKDGRKVLGVQARGMEFRMMSKTSKLIQGPAHELQPSIEQIIAKTDDFLAKYEVGTILFASEDAEYCERMVATYGDRVVLLPLGHYRFDPDGTLEELFAQYPAKASAENLVSTDRYVASMNLLAKANYFIAGRNSGSVYVATRGDFEDMYIFDLGLAGSGA